MQHESLASQANVAVQHLHGTTAPSTPLLRRVMRPMSWAGLAAVGVPFVPKPAPGQAEPSFSLPTSPKLPISPISPTGTIARMPAPKPREFFIQGLTLAGRTFRPSDWSERLAGALSSFRPKGANSGSGIGAHIGYSPCCVPQLIDGVRCVIVSEALRALEPMAWDFVMNFARDNELQVVEACLIADPAPDGAAAPPATTD